MKWLKPFWGSAIAALTLAVAGCSSTSEPTTDDKASDKYNLLFIMVDQLRFDAMSYAGNTVVHTPNLDKLAKDGVNFKNAYTTVAVCGPARSSVMTGHTAENTGVNTNAKTYMYNEQEVMTQPTFDEILADNGYHAEYYGKWHAMTKHTKVYKNPKLHANNGRSRFLHGGQKFMYMDYLNENFPAALLSKEQAWDPLTERAYVKSPMDRLYGQAYKKSDHKQYKLVQPDLNGVSVIPAEHSFTAFQSKEVINAIERLKDKTFTIQLNLHSPHAPMLPSPEYMKLYKPEDMPIPASIHDDMKNSPYKGANGRTRLTQYQDPKKVQHMIAAYSALVHEIDDWMGKIIAKLDEHNLSDKTMIVFTADHGEMLGAHGMREKNVFYEESAHIPLLIKLPDAIKSNVKIEGSVSTLDLFATVLDYLGAGEHASNGKSLRGMIEGTDHSHGEYVVTEWDYNGPVQPNYMVRKGDWKLMVPYSKDSKVIKALYDLESDPYELNNLIGNRRDIDPQHLNKTLELRSDLITWLSERDSKRVNQIAELTF